MDKVLELADKSGMCYVDAHKTITCTESALHKFYTLARADLEAENAKLRQTISDIAYGLEGARIWGGMEWAYNPLHPYKYLPLRDAARAALEKPND